MSKCLGAAGLAELAPPGEPFRLFVRKEEPN
jgi:hypothetical protein